MRYLSVCSGIEAATSAWHHLGWEPAAFAEIEPFPSAVLKHHYPDVPNLGDMSKFKEWNLGTIDLLVGGTPCQSFSVAGLRKGLDDPRGNLMLTYLAIAERYRPKWLVWENVPGVLSSNGGEDFASLLRGLVECGYGWAYRVLDAQYFGVAQRRRRVFVVGCLGDWRSAAAVLFERHSLSGNPAPSREKRQRTPGGPASSPRYGGSDAECSDTVTSKWAKGSGGPSGNECGLFVAQPVAHTLRAKYDASEDGTGRGTPLVPVGLPEVMSTLLSSTAGVSRPGNAATEHETYIPLCFQQNTRDEVRYINGDGQIAGALAAEAGMKQQNYLVQPLAWDEELNVRENLAGTILRGGQGGRHDGVAQPIAFSSNMSVPDCQTDVAPTLKLGGHGGNNPPAVAVDVYNQAIDGDTTATLTEACGGTNTSGPKVLQAVAFGVGEQPDIGHCLRSQASKADKHESTTYVAQSVVGALACNTGPNGHDAGNFACNQAVDAGHILAAPTPTISFDTYNQTVSGDTTQTLCSRGDTPGGNAHLIPAVQHAMAVRRLTPRECERLQGFPDDYTLIPWRGKDASQCPDGPRYKALGNSMAVPVMAWIGERIRMVDELPK